MILKRDKNKEKIYGAPSPPVQSAPAPPVDVPDTPKVTPAEVTLDAPQAPPDAYRDTPVPGREGLIMGSGDVHESSIDKSGESGIISGRGSGSGNSTNTEHTFEKIGEIDFSDKKAIAKSLQEFEQKYANSRIEHCRVFCTNGEVYEVHGDLDTVGTTLLGDKLKGSINEHNHVTGRSQYSFSWDDIKTSVEDGSSIVMAFDEKYRYSMVFPEEKIDLDEIEQVYIDCNNEVGDINAFSWQSKKIKLIKDEDYQHEVVRRVCERFGVKYERKRKA